MFSLDQKYIQRLVESSPDMIVAVDSAGTIVYYNDGARKSLHFGAQDMIGAGVNAIYPSIEEARRVMKAMRESDDSGRVSNFETVFRDKDGNLIPVMISGSIIHDDEGKEIGSIGFARDIRRMRQREQLATAGEIAVSLAHEINNPLESITNNLEMLSRAVEGHLKDAELATENEHLEAIRAGIGRVNAIVRRLDEMSRRGIYETRDYMNGKRMADLAPREAAPDSRHLSEQPPATPLSEQGWPLAGMAVLVLDDDVEVVTSLADVLRAERCIVHTATRPSAALGLLRNIKVDAVISDVVMPEMDGYEFYMHVKHEMPQIPVVLMTAYYYDKDHIIKRSKLRGLEGAIFKKPVNPAKLRQLLIAMRQKAAATPKLPVPPMPPTAPPQPGAAR
jgi:PAS domain S-box-containing protein